MLLPRSMAKHSKQHPDLMRLSESSGGSVALHRGNRPWSIAARRCVVALLPTMLTACNWAVLDPRGPVGHEDRTLLIDSLAIMLAIVIPTIIATFAFAWWYRESN